MKRSIKRVAAMTLALILSTSTLVFANAPETRDVTFGVNIVIDGQPITFQPNNSPFIMDGRTFLPSATLAELLGFYVVWDEATNTVLISETAPPVLPDVQPMPMPTFDPIVPVELPGGITPHDAFNRANEALMEAGSVRMSMVSDTLMIIPFMGEMQMRQVSTIDQVIRSETDIDMRMETRTYAEGEAFDMLMYFRDGASYTYMFGEWIVAEMDLEELLAMTGGSFDFDDGAILFETAVETANGFEVSFIISGEAMQELVNMSIAALGDLGAGDIELRIDDVTVSSTLNRDLTWGPADVTTMNMAFTMVAEGLEITFTTVMEMVLVQVGGITVDFPAVLDTL